MIDPIGMYKGKEISKMGRKELLEFAKWAGSKISELEKETSGEEEPIELIEADTSSYFFTDVFGALVLLVAVAFAGYLVFSSFMDWPWDSRKVKEAEMYMEDLSYAPSREYIENYFLSRAQDACAAEGGEWIAFERCLLEDRILDYQNHTLQGFDEYKALKNAEEVCSRNGGEWIDGVESGQYFNEEHPEGIIYGGADDSTCKVKNETYTLKDGHLIHEETKELK